MGELLYKELSYKIVGLSFNVFNELGYGYRENIYQRAFAEELKKNKLKYKSECPVRLKYGDRIIGTYFIDFIIADKIVIELKFVNDFYTRDIKQLISYLKATNLRLGILIIFTKEGIKYRRFAN
jgi:GxxExxY protein